MQSLLISGVMAVGGGNVEAENLGHGADVYFPRDEINGEDVFHSEAGGGFFVRGGWGEAEEFGGGLEGGGGEGGVGVVEGVAFAGGIF